MKSFVIYFCVLAIVAVDSQSPYCGQSCDHFGRTVPHIGCRKLNDFGSKCKDPKMVDMTSALKKLIVDGHNAKRQIVANGGIRHLKRPCKMANMQWDEELAKLAVLHAQQCVWDHDNCHPTSKFPYSGQNLALSFTTDPKGNLDAQKSITQAIDGWFAEAEDCKQANIDSYQQASKTIGHFTVMVHENNTHVGCAAIIYKEGLKTNLQTTCNYAENNMIGAPIYTSC